MLRLSQEELNQQIRAKLRPPERATRSAWSRSPLAEFASTASTFLVESGAVAVAMAA